ncbi:MAG: CopG family transcriptional regulator [Candidatus Aminicenantes bacterium]|nr:CopG family transcriptional regulator [Candidatus Aminicenantes bacterium]
MSKTVTLRISEDHYRRLKAYAQADNRKLSNAVETLALKQLDEELFVEPSEMKEILSDGKLLGRLKTGHGQARRLKGRFIE